MSKLTGRVLKSVGSIFVVDSNDIRYKCLGRGILKRNDLIVVGDIVEFDKINDRYVISKVKDRKNSLIRPPISNIDNALIVIAPIPKPDLMLVDKLIINCRKECIEPIICYNKTDIQDQELIDSIRVMYHNIVPQLYVSAVTGEGLSELKSRLIGKLTCFAGQSAVGKSSIINAMLGRDELEVGELSRIEKGRNTTRHIEIFDIGENILLADTCGFSFLENIDMPPEELPLYYDEYMEASINCKYKGCNHINEPHCAVKELVDKGILSSQRYRRYVEIYNDINKKWSTRYE